MELQQENEKEEEELEQVEPASLASASIAGDECSDLFVLPDFDDDEDGGQSASTADVWVFKASKSEKRQKRFEDKMERRKQSRKKKKKQKNLQGEINSQPSLTSSSLNVDVELRGRSLKDDDALQQPTSPSPAASTWRTHWPRISIDLSFEGRLSDKVSDGHLHSRNSLNCVDLPPSKSNFFLHLSLGRSSCHSSSS